MADAQQEALHFENKSGFEFGRFMVSAQGCREGVLCFFLPGGGAESLLNKGGGNYHTGLRIY